MDLDKFFRENEDWRPYADLVAIPPLPEELMKEFQDVSPEVLSRCMEFVKEGGGFVTRGAIYTRIRREDRKDKYKSEGDKWATMLCLQQPPGVRTTDTFWKGRKTWVDVFGEDYANDVKKGLARKGVSLTAGAEYMPELVRPGMGFGRHNPDPEAVVPFGGARSYIKRLCEDRGWACNGAVETKHRQPETDPLAPENCPLAPDIIRKKARQMVKQDPSLRKLKKGELREAVIAKYGPKY